MPNINLYILKVLLQAKSRLSNDAKELIRSFAKSKMHPNGGFIDRSGKQDPYYSVFGYTLSYVFDVEMYHELGEIFLYDWQSQNQVDFVHAVSLLRCYYLVEAIKYANFAGKLSKSAANNELIQKLIGKRIAKKIRTKHSDLLQVVTSYQSKDGGFNHLERNAENASVYANFLVYGLFQDLFFSKNWLKKIAQSSINLQLENGAFVNHPKSRHGVSSTTAAGIILLNNIGKPINNSFDWLQKQAQEHGGFLAGEEVPVADVLSTGTSVLALNMVGASNKTINNKAAEFANLHFDGSGGFFGSIADQMVDVEYTFYGLLAVGCN